MTEPELSPAVEYGTVRWTVVGFLPDSTDTGCTVRFEPRAPLLKTAPGAPQPATVLPNGQTYRVVAGRLVDASGSPDVVMVADGASTRPRGWTWQVSYELDKGQGFGTFDFHLDPGEVKDLTDAMPVLAADGVFYVDGPKGDPGPRGYRGDKGDTGDVNLTDDVRQFVTSLTIDNEYMQSLVEETGYVWAYVDQNGRRALAIRKDGTVDIPKIGLSAGAVPAAALGADVTLPIAADMDASDYAAVWTDTASRLAFWLRRSGAFGFGKLDAGTLSYLASALALGSSVAPISYTTPEGAVRSITSGPDIVCWGDSLTAGAGANTPAGSYPALANGFPGALATLTGRTVRNAGVGGETSVTIAARTGATPFLLLPVGGQIPASGGVVVSLLPINGSQPSPLKQGTGTPGSSFAGSLGGVPGTLTLDSSSGSDVYTFTRATAGSAVTVNRPAAYRTAFSEARRGDIAVLWLGQNGPSNARAIEDARAIVEYLSALNKRYLVISRPTSSDAEDAAWHAEFGRRFIAIRRYLADYGLSDAGIAPTTQDTADMAAGNVPTSLRIDGVHGNAAYYNIVAQQVNLRLREFGWV